MFKWLYPHPSWRNRILLRYASVEMFENPVPSPYSITRMFPGQVPDFRTFLRKWISFKFDFTTTGARIIISVFCLNMKHNLHKMKWFSNLISQTKTNQIKDSESMIPSFISLLNFSKYFLLLNILEMWRRANTRFKLSYVMLNYLTKLTVCAEYIIDKLLDLHFFFIWAWVSDRYDSNDSYDFLSSSLRFLN